MNGIRNEPSTLAEIKRDEMTEYEEKKIA